MNKNTKEKICAFYASDYHFEMMSLPYIDKKMGEKEEVIILTENNLEETMQKVLKSTNFKEEKKQQIINLNWKNNDLEKFKKMKEKIKEEKQLTIFIKGRENYIHNIHQNIERWIPEKQKVKIIDCYAMEEIGENLEKIINKYSKILKITGEKEIEKI